MVFNIKTSEANKAVVSELTRHMFPQGAPENLISRIALAYSLSTSGPLDLATDLRDSKGKEYRDETLFGTYKTYYVALLCQHYGLHKENHNLPKLMKMHVDDGLERLNQLFANNRSYSGLDFFIEHLERGVESLDEVTAGAVPNNNQTVTKGYFPGPITLQFGRALDEAKTPVRVVLNDTAVHENPHLAIAGGTATERASFAQALLQQFVEKTGGEVNFLYLDCNPAGQREGVGQEQFFERTRTTAVNSPAKPLPFNPLTFIDNVNEKNRLLGISKFVDMLTAYLPQMGATQTQQLKDAARRAFARKKGGLYPTLKDVIDSVLEVNGNRTSALTDAFEFLNREELFASKTDSKKSFLNQNYYFSFSGDLDKTIRFTATFLTIYYIYNTFMNMENAPVTDGVQAIRYVLLIDEAHHLLKDKKSQELLERMLREIRSKGVVVVLLSQGVEEFNQSSFDFSSMCENAVLLEIKGSLNLKPMSKFLGFSDTEAGLLGQSMGKIKKGLAVANVKEFKRSELFEIKQ